MKMLADSSGMTLVEVVVALGVILTGLIALIAVAPLSQSQVGEARWETTATFLSVQLLEQIRNSAWTSTVDLMCAGNAACTNGAAAPPLWPDQGYQTIVLSDGTSYPGYRSTVRISTCSVVACGDLVADPTQNTVRQITVTVFFTPMTGNGQGGATENSTTLTSLVARRL